MGLGSGTGTEQLWENYETLKLLADLVWQVIHYQKKFRDSFNFMLPRMCCSYNVYCCIFLHLTLRAILFWVQCYVLGFSWCIALSHSFLRNFLVQFVKGDIWAMNNKCSSLSSSGCAAFGWRKDHCFP